jgi:hypothetical protein
MLDSGYEKQGIQQLDPHEVRQIAKELEDSILAYKGDKDGNDIQLPRKRYRRLDPRRLIQPGKRYRRLDPRRLFAERRWQEQQEQQRQLYAWHSRADDAIAIARGIKGPRSLHSYAYKVGSSPVALAIFGSFTQLEIFHLVTHPGASGIGLLMVEKAVNVSNDLEYNGKVGLIPYSSASVEFYASVGFDGPQGREDRMKLDPTHSPHWEMSEGIWHLA